MFYELFSNWVANVIHNHKKVVFNISSHTSSSIKNLFYIKVCNLLSSSLNSYKRKNPKRNVMEAKLCALKSLNQKKNIVLSKADTENNVFTFDKKITKMK